MAERGKDEAGSKRGGREGEGGGENRLGLQKLLRKDYGVRF
jgi:hypothetical protein